MIMFWDKKSDKSRLPDLPMSNAPFRPSNFSFPESPDEAEKHALPSFPDSPNQKGFSQAAIKDAITTEEVSDTSMPEFPTLNEKEKSTAIEMEEWTPSTEILRNPAIKEIEDIPENYPGESQTKKLSDFKPYLSSTPQTLPEFKPAMKNSDVFVKIDKFHTARKSLTLAQQEIENVSDLLKKIRETKLREEQELSAWEKDIANAKSRVQEVSSNIFEKVE